MKKSVIVVMGSPNDADAMAPAVTILKKLGIETEVWVASAHRTPDRAAKLAAEARGRGVGAIIAGAGLAHHLGGALAARTTLPIIAVPIAAGAMQGVDALISAVQMPPGVPVAAVAVGGAKNAGLLAAEMLSIADEDLAAQLDAMRDEQIAAVEEADRKVKEKLA
jgi:phosphoribosylaminoimidazole carboxylase PurE protein